ncbi:flavodoxin [Vibrio atypicus]|jgi:hypothetical protein|uniref:flavodoxin n=1 Tax=Vibrio atypicus TaxID=558271 RepID=UPI0013585E83|nr:flavodoxin [Vibrio atypicus]
MTDSIPKVANLKNQWLSQHVDVQYPTQESLAGRKLYLSSVEKRSIQPFTLTKEDNGFISADDIFLVDFHRLTVMFALLQSKRWTESSEQELIVEFLTQIIYSEPCELYIGFTEGEPTAAAIVTRTDSAILVSDIITTNEDAQQSAKQFAASLLHKLDINLDEYSDAYLEI